jgi:hypothetical protein
MQTRTRLIDDMLALGALLGVDSLTVAFVVPPSRLRCADRAVSLPARVDAVKFVPRRAEMGDRVAVEWLSSRGGNEMTRVDAERISARVMEITVRLSIRPDVRDDMRSLSSVHPERSVLVPSIPPTSANPLPAPVFELLYVLE